MQGKDKMGETRQTARTAAVALSLTLLLMACSGLSTSTDYDPAANFGSYSSYSWTSSGGTADDLTNARIKSAVDAALAAKGLSKVDSGGDLAVGYQVTTAEQTDYTTVGSGFGGYGWGWGGGGMATTTEQTYTQGTVILAMFDESTKNLVWKGTASNTVNPGASPEDRAKNIQSAVDKMLADFPPGS